MGGWSERLRRLLGRGNELAASTVPPPPWTILSEYTTGGYAGFGSVREWRGYSDHDGLVELVALGDADHPLRATAGDDWRDGKFVVARIAALERGDRHGALLNLVSVGQLEREWTIVKARRNAIGLGGAPALWLLAGLEVGDEAFFRARLVPPSAARAGLSHPDSPDWREGGTVVLYRQSDGAFRFWSWDFGDIGKALKQEERPDAWLFGKNLAAAWRLPVPSAPPEEFYQYTDQVEENRGCYVDYEHYYSIRRAGDVASIGCFVIGPGDPKIDMESRGRAAATIAQARLGSGMPALLRALAAQDYPFRSLLGTIPTCSDRLVPGRGGHSDLCIAFDGELVEITLAPCEVAADRGCVLILQHEELSIEPDYAWFGPLADHLATSAHRSPRD